MLHKLPNCVIIIHVDCKSVFYAFGRFADQPLERKRNMSNFSELLSQLIRGREANVSQLARTCGIHPPTLHQYMNGKRAMHNEDELERLAAACTSPSVCRTAKLPLSS